MIASYAHAEMPQVGTIVPPYPQGLAENEGACVGSGDALRVCEYSIGILSDASGKPLWILAKHFERYDEAGRPYSLVTDVLAYPHTSGSRVLLLWTCLFRNEPDASVMALVKNPAAQAKPASDWAYKVDLSTGKFVRLNPRDVTCYEPQGDD
ncbi:MAG TPA: hypothetical protein VEH07_08185 [Alphaproteobacteria bacterium]|nr:hypothetical protein [Alphaproteobacteria bacterium]